MTTQIKANTFLQQAKQEFASFYKNALLYLACIDLQELTETERASRAYNLSVAALVSDTIYNFGELLLHPILDSLTQTPAQLAPRASLRLQPGRSDCLRRVGR